MYWEATIVFMPPFMSMLFIVPIVLIRGAKD
jgi:hypothetical protein